MRYVIVEIVVYLGVAVLLGLGIGYLLWYAKVAKARTETNVMAVALQDQVSRTTTMERALQQTAAERDELRVHAAALTSRAERAAAELESLRGEVSELRPLAEQAPDLRRKAEELRVERDRLAAASVEAVSAGEVAAIVAAANVPAPSYVGEEDVETLRAAPDDLQRISGVGPHLEKLLNTNRIFTFRQIAVLSPEGVRELDDQLGFKGRIERDEWTRQARELHQDAYGDEPEAFR